VIRWLVAILVALATPAMAQVAPAPALTERANQLPEVMAGKIAYDAYFAEGFRAAVPEAQFKQINAQLTAANGPVTKVEGITANTPFSGTVKLGYERAVANVEIAVDPAAPHLVTGMRLTGAETRDDSIAKLSADFAKLSGKRGLLIRELTSDGDVQLAIDADAKGAIGSGFKLWVLAETVRAVNAGETRWIELMPLGPDQPSSATTANWPPSTPMTVQALATAMISVSDNRATDALIRVLDRAKLDAIVAATGYAGDPARTLPVLTTGELFALRSKANAAIAAEWATLTPAQRRDRLAKNRDAIDATKVDASQFSRTPGPIDSIEWFASPADMAKLLDWLRQDVGGEAREILATNPGVAPALAARFEYIGFKGGSEPGVIAMNFLVQTKAQRWYAVTGFWNDAAKPVHDLTFATLMSRALGLVPQE
jgi:beta-lactamase class A